jgi:hypothetical protein
MVDSKDGAMLKGGGGYLHLQSNVISVADQGRLDVDIYKILLQIWCYCCMRLSQFPGGVMALGCSV